jgi:hypothetical protein
MDIATAWSNVNWWSVLVATLSAFILGAMWYSPKTIGKIWIKEAKIDLEKAKSSNMLLLMGITFVLQFISTLVMELFIGANATLSIGLAAGAFVGIGWVATSFGTSYLFSQKSLRLYFIDAGYYIVLFLIVGAILGAW